MKKISKPMSRIISMLLALVMVFGMFPVSAFAESVTTSSANSFSDGSDYVIVSNGKALENVNGEIKPKEYNNGDPITNSIRWTAVASGSGYKLMNNGSYLIGTKNSDPAKSDGSISLTSNEADATEMNYDHTANFVYGKVSGVEYSFYYSTSANIFKIYIKSGAANSNKNASIYLVEDSGSDDDTPPAEPEHTCSADTLTTVPGQAPTCGEAGYEPYWQCDVCNQKFTDENAEYAIDTPVAISATGNHSFGDNLPACSVCSAENPDYEAPAAVTYTKIDADDIAVGKKIVIVGDGNKALTNPKENGATAGTTTVSPSGDTLTLTEAEAADIVWTVGKAEGNQVSTYEQDFTFSNGDLYIRRENVSSTEYVKAYDYNTSIGDKAKYFGFDVKNNTIGTYTGDGRFYGLFHENSGFRFKNMNNGNGEQDITFYAAPAEDDEEEDTTVAVTSISLDKTSASLEVGGSVTLTPTVAPPNATNKAVTWTSSDETVATVANGTVTAVGAGEATITATAGGMSATCTVTVTAAQSGNTKEVTLTTTKNTIGDKAKTSATIAVGDTLTVTVTSGSGGNRQHNLSVDQEGIVELPTGTFDTGRYEIKSFTVKGLKAGTAVITLTSNDDTSGGGTSIYYGQVTVTVTGDNGGNEGGSGDNGGGSDGTGTEHNIGFTSDMHSNTNNLSTWLTAVQKKLNPKLELVAFGGDYATATSAQGTKYANEAKKIIDAAGITGVYTAGNHDWESTPGDPIQINTLAYDGEDYDIYVMGAYSSNGTGTYNDDSINKLKAYLEDSATETDEPMFIVTHYPLHPYSYRTTTNADKVIDVLNDYPNVIFIWGHNHSQSDTNYGDDGIKVSGQDLTYASGKTKKINFTYASSGGMNDGANQGIYGLIANVDGDKVTLTYTNVNGATQGTPVMIEMKDPTNIETPDQPSQGGETITAAITLDKEADNATITKQINVGDKLVITLTNPSGGSKALSAAVEGNKNIAEINPESFDINKNNGTKQVTITGQNAGTAKITFSGKNTTADGGRGSVYYAVINLTVNAVATHTHTLAKVGGQAATCTVDGWKDYYQCQDTDCGAYFADEAGQNPIEKLSTWQTGDGKIAAGHTYGTLIEKVPATHTKDELKAGMEAHYKCACGKFFTSEKVETTEAELVIAAPTHDYSVPGTVTAATCTQTGSKVMKCSGCEATETTTLEIDSKNHTYGTLIEKVPATHTKDELKAGMEAHYKCACDKFFTSEKVETTEAELVIAAPTHTYGTYWEKDSTGHWHKCSCGATTDVEGHKSDALATETAPELCATCGYEMNPIQGHTHDWGETTYNFAEDGSTCTAQRVCTKNDTHVETATATITSEVKTDATCEAKGTTTYTATFTETWAKIQTLDVEDIAAKDHAWTVTYNFATDGSGCTATHVCGNDAAHNETATATITSAVKTDATCEAKGTTTYTATFTETWAKTQYQDVQDIPVSEEHDYQNGICSVCGAADPDYKPADTEETFTLVENVTTGKYVVVAVKNNNRYGMTGTYVDSNSANGYNGMKAASVTVADGKITSDVSADMIWQVTVTGGKIVLKNVSQDKFLNAVYETSGSSATNRNVYLDANSVTWAQDSDKALFTENTATKGYLALDNDAKVFSMRGAGAASNKSTIEFYQVGNHKHDAEHVQKADATCTETGMEEYWFCEGCGTYFADADCKEETTADALIIDKIAHAYGNKVGKVDAIHNANELKNGMAAHYQCSVCKAYFDADKHATTAEALVITAAHSYSNELSFNESKHWYACECGAKKDEANHNFSAGKCTDCQATDPNYVPEDNEKDFTLVENVTTGKYVVVAVKNNNRYGMTGTYVDSNKADGYNGMKAASVTVANGKITSDVSADMIWQVTVTGGKIVLKNVSQDKFLNAVYETSGSSATNRNVYLDANSVTWAQDSDKALFTENTATKGYLALDNDAKVFSMRGAGAASNKSTIEFYQVGAGAVVEPEVTVKSIAVTTNPTKMTYTAGENFDPAGMVVTATYSDGTTAAVTGYTLSGDKNLAAGQKEITITFEGQTTKLTVTVNANQPVVPGSGSNIGFTSDMHQNTGNLRKWLTNVQNNVDPDLEYMAFGGDYMWNNGITYFREAVSIVNDLVGKDKGIYTTGNHEYDSSSTVDRMEGTTGFLVTGKPSNETAPNYEIYLMGAEGNGSGTYGTFTATARGDLERYLKTAPKDQPIFIVAHWPLHYNNDRTTTGASEMIELLNQYPNTILLWGHNHSMGTDDQYGQIKTAGEEIIITSSNTKKTINFTYANAGGMNDGGKKGSWGNESYNIHGMVANVSASGDQVTLKYYDLNGNLVGDSATIRIAEAAEHVHKPEHKDKVDSTCTETGMKEHYYCTCGKYFSDAEGKSEVNAATLVIAKKSHQYVDITYDWDDDYSKCTASGTCSVGNHEDTAIATKIEAFVVKNPTCEESGTTNHVASFTGDNSWATTDTKVETVDATGHNYGTADYAWSNDNSTCTATRTCRNNSDHVERVTENSTVNAAQSKAPTCGEEGETVYVVVFNVTGLVNQTKTVTVNATGNHTYSNEWTTSEAQHWHACTVCGDKSDLGNHVPGAAATETNPQKCNTCDRVLAPATGHVEHNFTVKVEETPATCTTKGTKIMKCNGCNETQSVDLPIVSDAHKWDDGRITTAATCTTKGVKTYTCEHNSSHKKTEEVAIDRNNHTYQNGFCTGCGAEEGSVPEGPIIELDPEVFGDKVEVWVDGIESDIKRVGDEYYVQLPNGADATNMVTYSFKNATSSDVHTQYPESMQVWALKKNADGSYAAERIADLDNILVYCGSSIRITGTKGIRMITGIDQAKRNKLINEGLAGYKVMEYGTVLALSSNLGEDESLTLDHEHAKSNYAYKRGVADPVFAYSGNLVQYTNVLVGFSPEQCKEDIVMRSYMKLQDADGKEITIYGGPVCRSIGYIAYQNKDTFAAGTDAYKYVWEIIKAAYGNQYDAEYKG